MNPHVNSTEAEHGTLLSIMWQPGWEGSLGENRYTYMYGCFFAVHVKLLQHCQLVIPEYKIKSFFFFLRTDINTENKTALFRKTETAYATLLCS